MISSSPASHDAWRLAHACARRTSVISTSRRYIIPLMHTAIIGGGVIGLALARELAAAGADVSIFDPRPPASEASWAAAGMLVPDSEEHSSEPFHKLCVAS